MKFLTLFANLITAFKTKLLRNNNDEESIIHLPLQSDKLEKKLALLIKDIETINQSDLNQVEYKKLNQETNNDLFSSYRFDFHTRDDLNRFKKKYKSLLL